MSGTEIANLMTQGIVTGLLQGAMILAPYAIGFCAICVVIHFVKNRKKK